MNFYGSPITDPDNQYKDFMQTYITSYNGANQNIRPVLASIKTSSLNESTSDENFQASTFSTIVSYLNQQPYWTQYSYGTAFFEFSDEWWRSDLSTGGYDVEGCPNSNPYSHTACGITTVFGPYPLEYSGLFGLRDVPLGYCIVPKQIVSLLMLSWNSDGTPPPQGQPICAGLTQVVPILVYPILVCICLLVIALLLVLPTPKPPKVTDRQLQYFADDDLERTQLDRAAPSVNSSPQEPLSPNILNTSLRANPVSNPKPYTRAPNSGQKKKMRINLY